MFKNCLNPEISKDEMRIFIAIVLMSGYNRVPDKRTYWEDCEDVHNPMVLLILI